MCGVKMYNDDDDNNNNNNNNNNNHFSWPLVVYTVS